MDDEFTLREVIRVPKDRVGVIIGKKGKTRRKLEKMADVKIRVDSKTGEVEITALPETRDENFYKAVLAIRAMARGFDHVSATELFADDRYLEILDLKDILRSRSAVRRQKARLIGTEGSVRKKLEALTDTKIRIYGDTVSIIGDAEGIDLAKRAIVDIAVEGRPHSTVFHDLELQRSRRRRMKLLKDLGFEIEE